MGTFCRWSFPSAKCVHCAFKKQPLLEKKTSIKEVTAAHNTAKAGGKEGNSCPSCNTCCSMLQVESQQGQEQCGYKGSSPGCQEKPGFLSRIVPEHTLRCQGRIKVLSPAHILPSKVARLQQKAGTCSGFDIQTCPRGLEKGEVELQKHQLSCSSLGCPGAAGGRD